MTDQDKMMAFGSWLNSRIQQLQLELYALSVNSKVPVDSIRVKAGHMEAFGHVLAAFKDLYHGDINKFMQEYLGQQPEEDDKESKDV
jgi:hypothetical protein